MEVRGEANRPEEKRRAVYAFPRETPVAESVPAGEEKCTEMTLRDWFAGQALAGVLAKMTHQEYLGSAHVEIVGDAYDLADAMLERRTRR